MCQIYLFSSTRRIPRRKEVSVHKYALCTLGPQPALDTFTLSEPSALVSVFCQSAKLEARVRFSYRETSQQRRAYKPLLAFLICFLSRWCVRCQGVQYVFSLTAFALCLLCAVVNKRVTHLKHRKITVSPAASHSGGVFPPLSYYYPPSPLLYTSDTVRLNFTSCHSARMASLPSHPLTLTCTNTQTHKLAARGGAKRWRCSGPVMTRPSCKHLALCVCTCVCTRVCV